MGHSTTVSPPLRAQRSPGSPTAPNTSSMSPPSTRSAPGHMGAVRPGDAGRRPACPRRPRCHRATTPSRVCRGPPPRNSGAAITDYVIQYSSDDGSTWSTFDDGVSTDTSTMVTGLTNGTVYVFHVAAVNTEGTGRTPPIRPAVTPATVPDAPANAAGNIRSVCPADAPVDDGGNAITDYFIQYSTDSGSTWGTFEDGTSTNTTATVTGLNNGTVYIFHVAAVNGVDDGRSPPAAPCRAEDRS